MRSEPNATAEPLLDRIADVLRGRLGPELAITAPRIGAELGAPERAVRRAISAHYPELCLQLGKPVVCRAGLGFFLSTDAEQLAEQALTLRRQKFAVRDAERRFRQVLTHFGLDGILTSDAQRERSAA